MPLEQVTIPIWVSLDIETRNKLRQIFLIPKSSHADVVTDHMGVARVMSDGTTNEDLKQLSVEKMRDYLGTAAINETVYDLFKQVVDKIEKVETFKEIENLPNPFIQVIHDKVDFVPKVLKCEDCDYTHASKQGLRMHILKKHLKK